MGVTRVLTGDEGDESVVTVTVDAAIDVVAVVLAVTVVEAVADAEADAEAVDVAAATELVGDVSGCGGKRGVVAVAVVVDCTVTVDVGIIVLMLGLAPAPLQIKPMDSKNDSSALRAIKGPPGARAF